MAGRVTILHWNQREAEERTEIVRSTGYEADEHSRVDPAVLRELATSPPLAFVVDLTRLPSRGGDGALALRARARTRPVPRVPVEGRADAAAQLRQPGLLFRRRA
jgi:hypothetical protein